MDPALMYKKAFQQGQILNIFQGQARVTCVNIGELLLSSGKLVACDPLDIEPGESFSIELGTGRYPVILSIANILDQKSINQIVAAAMIQVSRKEPVKWELATVPGQDLSLLTSNEFYGHSVESGISSFLDLDVASVLASHVEAWSLEETEEFGDEIFTGNSSIIETLRHDINMKLESVGWGWSNVELNRITKANVIAFSCGFGDDVYADYYGYAEDGSVACFLSDFKVFVSDETVI